MGGLAVEADAGKLMIRRSFAGFDDPDEISPISDTEFLARRYGARLAFRLDEHSKVISVSVSWEDLPTMKLVAAK